MNLSLFRQLVFDLKLLFHRSCMEIISFSVLQLLLTLVLARVSATDFILFFTLALLPETYIYSFLSLLLKLTPK